MGIDNNVSVTGNVTRDPELRFTQGGMAVASFGLAWNLSLIHISEPTRRS